jgi:Cyclin M transmembrane N-terminal domain
MPLGVAVCRRLSRPLLYERAALGRQGCTLQDGSRSPADGQPIKRSHEAGLQLLPRSVTVQSDCSCRGPTHYLRDHRRLEFSLISVDKARVAAAGASGDSRAKGLLLAVTDLTRHLSAAQFGITLSSLLIGFIAEPLVADLLHPLLVGATGARTRSAARSASRSTSRRLTTER